MPTAKRRKSKAVTWDIRKGRCKGGGRSSKAKGRIAVEEVRELLLAWFPLFNDDVFVKATSQGGCDLHLSPIAQKHFPYDPEVKNVERMDIFKALAQAQNNAEKYPPIVFFKRAHTPMFVALSAEQFLKLLAKE